MYPLADIAAPQLGTRFLLWDSKPFHRMQALAQYFLPPGAGSFSDSWGQYRVGVCRLNARFFSCIVTYYRAEILFLLAGCVLFLWLKSRRSRVH